MYQVIRYGMITIVCIITILNCIYMPSDRYDVGVQILVPLFMLTYVVYIFPLLWPMWAWYGADSDWKTSVIRYMSSCIACIPVITTIFDGTLYFSRNVTPFMWESFRYMLPHKLSSDTAITLWMCIYIMYSAACVISILTVACDNAYRTYYRHPAPQHNTLLYTTGTVGYVSLLVLGPIYVCAPVIIFIDTVLPVILDA